MKNKITIITGASRGVGRSTAIKFAESGSKVILAARSADQLDQLSNEITDLGGTAIAIPTDVTDQDQVKNLIEKTITNFGQIDVLINNAGSGIFESVVDSDPTKWQSVIGSNLKSVYLCSRAVLPSMLDRGSGQILNVLSIAARVAFPFSSAYCAAKAAALAFTNVLRAEVRSKGIRVTAITPGSINSSFWDRMPQHPDRNLMLRTEDLAETILNVARSPIEMTVEEIIVTPPLGIL